MLDYVDNASQKIG